MRATIYYVPCMTERPPKTMSGIKIHHFNLLLLSSINPPASIY